MLPSRAGAARVRAARATSPPGTAAPLLLGGRPPPRQPLLVRRHPGARRQVRAAGGARKWFEKQLAAGPASPTRGTTGLRDWWAPGLAYAGNAGAAALWDRQKREVEGGWEVMANYQRWALARRIRSTTARSSR